MAYQFPDPSVSTTYVGPNGMTWTYVDGAWELDNNNSDPVEEITHDDLAEEIEENEEQLQAATTLLMGLQTKVHNLEDLDIQNALSALAQASQDIIDLKSKVNSLELTHFLILE